MMIKINITGNDTIRQQLEAIGNDPAMQQRVRRSFEQLSSDLLRQAAIAAGRQYVDTLMRPRKTGRIVTEADLAQLGIRRLDGTA